MNEPLDFCRVKKISDKGYGFLNSLYYPGDIFFHFSQIKKEEFLDKLNLMKRGDFFLYFVSSVARDNRRQVRELWYSLTSVPPHYIPAFSATIASCFNTDNVNLFDLLHAFSELRNIGYNDPVFIETILTSKKIIKLPTTIMPFLNADEIRRLDEILYTRS